METQNEIDPQQGFKQLVEEIKRRQRWRIIKRAVAIAVGITMVICVMKYFNVSLV